MAANVSRLPSHKRTGRRVSPSAKTSPAPEKRLYVLDTNVLLDDSDCIFKFGPDDIYIPIPVIQELDKFKGNDNEKGYRARTAARRLDAMSLAGANSGSAEKSAPLADFWDTDDPLLSGKIIFSPSGDHALYTNEGKHKVDTVIIKIANQLRERYKQVYADVVLVSNDTNVRIQARMQGVTVEGYERDGIPPIRAEVPNFVESKRIPTRNVEFFDTVTVHASRTVISANGATETEYEVDPDALGGRGVNQFIACGEGEKTLLLRIVDTGASTGRARVRTVPQRNKIEDNIAGILARDLEQSAALELLLDPSVEGVVIEGMYGTAKTLLTLAAAMAMVKSGVYDEILYVRSVMGTDKEEDIGFLSGDQDEKTDPWRGPLEDSFCVINRAMRVLTPANDWSQVRGIFERIKFQPLKFIQGRSFYRTIIILDEAQNLSLERLKGVLSRVGEESKVVVLGDAGQINNPALNRDTCGITRFMNAANTDSCYGATRLVECYRSRFARFVANVF